MSEATGTTFKSLPREVRDSIYNFALVDAHFLAQPQPRFLRTKGTREFRGYVQCTYTEGIGLNLNVQGLESFLILLHRWACKSSIAREACMAFYMNNIFYMSSSLLPHVLEPSVRWNVLLEPGDFPSKSEPQCHRRLCRGISPNKYLRHYLIKTEASCSEILHEGFKSATSDALGRILELRNIKSVQIALSVIRTHALDICPTPIGVAAIAGVCTLLGDKIGLDQESLKPEDGLRCSTFMKGLSVEVWTRVFNCCASGSINTSRRDITSLWNVPDNNIRKRVREGVADQNETPRVLMADQPENLAKCLRGLV